MRVLGLKGAGRVSDVDLEYSHWLANSIMLQRSLEGMINRHMAYRIWGIDERRNGVLLCKLMMK